MDELVEPLSKKDAKERIRKCYPLTDEGQKRGMGLAKLLTLTQKQIIIHKIEAFIEVNEKCPKSAHLRAEVGSVLEQCMGCGNLVPIGNHVIDADNERGYKYDCFSG